MTTLNTIEDLARILREQPTWAEAMRALILGQDLLDLPARLDKFIEEQRQFNEEQRETNRELRQFNEEQRQFNEEQREINRELRQFNEEQRESSNRELRQFNEEQRQFNEEQREINQSFNQRFNSIEGRLGNIEGGQYERTIRARALARCMMVFGFQSAYIAQTQDSSTDPRLTSTIQRAVNNGAVTRDRAADLYAADLVISANDNRHAVFEVSITADNGMTSTGRKHGQKSLRKLPGAKSLL